MKKLLHALFCAVLLGLAGCLPQERFWWSPDGTRAVVAIGDQLYLTTPGDELRAPISEDLKLESDELIRVSWLPDGSGFVLRRERKVASWDEARALLPAAEVKEIERYAAGVPALLNAAVAMSGEGDVGTALWSIAPNRDKDFLTTAFFCALSKNKAAIESAVQSSLKAAEFWAEAGGELSHLRIHELCVFSLKDNQATPLVRSFQPVVLPEVSPKAPLVAYWHVRGEGEIGLSVCSLDGKSRIDVPGTNYTTFGWTPDGRSLVFSVPVSGKDGLFQSIRRAKVADDSGKLLETIEPVELAVAIMTDPARLCVLPDGRVLFASQPATLPVQGEGLNLGPRLFVASADGKSVNMVPTAPGDLPTNLSFFAASPDGKRVAVVESDTDAVAVVELATGKTDIVSSAHTNWKCRTMPAWKSATELTFAALDAPDGKPRWMLWADGKGIRNISEKWPEDTTAKWLEKKEQQKSSP